MINCRKLTVPPRSYPPQAFPSTLHTGLSMSQNVGVLAAQVAGMELIKLFAFHVAARFNMM